MRALGYYPSAQEVGLHSHHPSLIECRLDRRNAQRSEIQHLRGHEHLRRRHRFE